MTLRLVVADDHSVVLAGLRALLALESDMEVAAVCTNGLEAIEAVETHDPDVLLLDATMPECTGLEAHRRLRDRGIKVPTIVLSATLSDEDVLACLQSSVDGIVLKESAASALIDAVRAVARGERWIPPELTARAVELMGQEEDDDEDPLTPREREVVERVAAGGSNKRVAAELGIAESTVKLHLHSAFTKLGVRNRVQLSLLARERGWI